MGNGMIQCKRIFFSITTQLPFAHYSSYFLNFLYKNSFSNNIFISFYANDLKIVSGCSDFEKKNSEQFLFFFLSGWIGSSSLVLVLRHGTETLEIKLVTVQWYSHGSYTYKP